MEGSSGEWEIGEVVRVRGDAIDAVGMMRWWCRMVRRVLAEGMPRGRRNWGIATGISFLSFEVIPPDQ